MENFLLFYQTPAQNNNNNILGQVPSRTGHIPSGLMMVVDVNRYVNRDWSSDGCRYLYVNCKL